MEVLTPPKRVKQTQQPPDKKPKLPFGGLLLLLALGCLILMTTEFDEFVRKTPDGNYELSPEREEDLERRLEQIDNAEQYALIATKSGLYPCFNCGNKTKIYLYIGEVWKYGVTKNGVRRYSKSWYRKMNLRYWKQFEGTYSECMKMELKQIYKYPMLPENLKRDYKLPRPPGNIEDY